ncbi:c1q globular head domain containing protein [uncultured Mediterranean phage uvMED]|nr:c1q globular head domain containing protein [uncultured Mediterranean phage uvMED]BAQ90903.1 c1q globular head domain containing protein [uncultured Mediterranean phage uvMED]
MAFIGKEPQIGAYSVLDDLTASATASYSLTLDSVAFVPESSQHLIVSLNGVIQKNGGTNPSFTVSGSTLTFSSALTSSDSINFVYALGSVLDIGTPSDATVTNAKTNFVSTSSAAGLQIKGDNTTAGTLQLNCEQNSHGIKLRSPAHSTSSSYTLTFPGTDPSADKFLKTDGSGNLSFADAGGSMTPAFQAYATAQTGITDNTATKVNFDTELFDTDGCYDTSNKRFLPTTAGKYYIYAVINFDAQGTDKFHSGMTSIYKNGSYYKHAYFDEYDNYLSYAKSPFVGAAIDFNGSSDYVEVYATFNITSGTSHRLTGGAYSSFGGYKIIGA